VTSNPPTAATVFDSLKAYVGFDATSSALLADAHPRVAPYFPAIIDDFYAAIEAHPDARSMITGGAAQIVRHLDKIGNEIESSTNTIDDIRLELEGEGEGCAPFLYRRGQIFDGAEPPPTLDTDADLSIALQRPDAQPDR
jgi:hypothetical protein